MVHELSALVVFANEAKRDTLYDFIQDKRDKVTTDIEGEIIVTRPTILGDSEPVKITKWTGDPYPDGWVEGDTIPSGQQTYAVSFSIRFRNTNQRQTIIDNISTIKSHSLAGRVYKHVCGHDEGKGCEPNELVGQWIKATLTARQKRWIKDAYNEIEV